MPIIITHDDPVLLSRLAQGAANARNSQQAINDGQQNAALQQNAQQSQAQQMQRLYEQQDADQRFQQEQAAAVQRQRAQQDFQQQMEAQRQAAANARQESGFQNQSALAMAAQAARLNQIDETRRAQAAQDQAAVDQMQQAQNDATPVPMEPRAIIGRAKNGQPIYADAPSPAARPVTTGTVRGQAGQRVSIGEAKAVDPYEARMRSYADLQATRPGYVPPTVAAPTADMAMGAQDVESRRRVAELRRTASLAQSMAKQALEAGDEETAKKYGDQARQAADMAWQLEQQIQASFSANNPSDSQANFQGFQQDPLDSQGWMFDQMAQQPQPAAATPVTTATVAAQRPAQPGFGGTIQPQSIPAQPIQQGGDPFAGGYQRDGAFTDTSRPGPGQAKVYDTETGKRYIVDKATRQIIREVP
jgi:hypothetical protein